jgi:ribonuclease I
MSSNIRVQTSAASVHDQFRRRDPALVRDSVVLRSEGQYLAEVQLCMDRGLHAHACGAGVHSICRGNTFIVRPLR